MIDPTEGLDCDWLTLLPYALGIAVLLTLFVGATTSTAAFGLHNPDWDGTADFRDTIEDEPSTELTILESTDTYDEFDPTETVVFVVAPEERYDDLAAGDVGSFVEAGGTVVVLENVGVAGNELLASIGAEARFDGRLLRDDRQYESGPLLPVVTTVPDHTSAIEAEQVTLNHGTAVVLGEDGPAVERGATAVDDIDVLARSSQFAQLTGEADNETAAEPVDTSTAYPVATAESVGAGQVVAIGDPSLTINAMVDRGDNAAFLAAQYADATEVVIDRSHGNSVPLTVTALETLREQGVLQAMTGLVIVLGVGALSSPRVRRLLATARDRGALITAVLAGVTPSIPAPSGDPTLTNDEYADRLRQRYPELDDDQIATMVATVTDRDETS